MQFGPVDEWTAAGSGAEEDVLGDGHLVDEREFLVNDREAGPLGVGDAVKVGGSAIDEQLTFVRTVRVQAAEELDERGFARAVLPAQRVDFTVAQIEGDVIERDAPPVEFFW